MIVEHRQLLYSDVDGLAYIAAQGKFDKSKLITNYEINNIGPLLELLQLSIAGRIPKPDGWLKLNELTPFVKAFYQEQKIWISPNNEHAGLIRTKTNGIKSSDQLTVFLMTAKRAANKISGLPKKVSGQLIAAMEELENNIYEHADAPDTGIVVFKADPGVFEFVVADLGIGILHSLQSCSVYDDLNDYGNALMIALSDGASRHGPNSGHGHGFRPIFTGLVNMYGELRFRSGDHALIMDGTSPDLITAKISQKAYIDGFFACIRCYVNQKN